MQVDGYLAAIDRAERQRHKQQLMLLRAAQASGKTFQEVFNAL